MLRHAQTEKRTKPKTGARTDQDQDQDQDQGQGQGQGQGLDQLPSQACFFAAATAFRRPDRRSYRSVTAGDETVQTLLSAPPSASAQRTGPPHSLQTSWLS
eukprot:COSAG04_NODE_601_length_12210_cov_5.548510_2_plen_101_part_00